MNVLLGIGSNNDNETLKNMKQFLNLSGRKEFTRMLIKMGLFMKNTNTDLMKYLKQVKMSDAFFNYSTNKNYKWNGSKTRIR